MAGPRYISYIERAFAIVVALVGLVCSSYLIVAPHEVLDPVWAMPHLFNVPTFNIYFFIATAVVAALLALYLAARPRLPDHAYSLAAGLATWSIVVVPLGRPAWLDRFIDSDMALFSFLVVPWTAARFAFRFPAELDEAPHDAGGWWDRWQPSLGSIRRAIDSVWYPVGFALMLVGATVMEGYVPAPVGDSIVGWTLLLMFGGMLGLAILLLSRQRAQADAAGLRRLRWIWLGAAGAMAVLVLALGIAFPLANHPETMWVAFLLAGFGPAWFIACLVVAVFFSDALDPRLALRRATLYSTLAVVLTSLFVAVEAAAQAFLLVNLGLPDVTGLMLAGTVVALTLSPLRRFTESKVRRLVEAWMPPEVQAEGQRAQTAIAFIDLTGYTELCARDEHTAIVLAAALHREMARVAASHGGRVVKKIGDALMLEFRASQDGLEALRAGHAGFVRVVHSLGLPLLRAHGGVHEGEVVRMTDGDVMGTAVNVAARLMAAAGPDEVLVSVGRATPPSEGSVELVRCKGIPEPVPATRFRIGPEEVNGIAQLDG